MPVTTTGLALLTIGNTALGFYSSQQQAAGIKRQGQAEAALLEQNAGYADAQAQDALEIGKDQASRHAAEVRRLIGSQRASIGASGIDLGSGSALDLQEESAMLGELDRTMIVNNAKREAWGFTVQAADLRNRAKLTRAGASNLAQSARNQGYTTLINGAADLGNLYRKSR